MNILPLILALMLMLSVLTVERLERFKNQTIVQNQYQNFLQHEENLVFNVRQKLLFDEKSGKKDHKQLTFRYLVKKEWRDNNLGKAKQNRDLMKEFLKIVYGHATFYKELEDTSQDFLEELLDAIQEAADEAPKDLIKRIEDIARLKLKDPALQKAFYRMLKGTISWEQRKEVKEFSPEMQKKAYVSLLAFINYNDKYTIQVQHAPRELLKAIFVNDEVVEAVIAKRNELAEEKDTAGFKSEFEDKRRPGIENTMLDFTISGSDKTDYD